MSGNQSHFRQSSKARTLGMDSQGDAHCAENHPQDEDTAPALDLLNSSPSPESRKLESLQPLRFNLPIRNHNPPFPGIEAPPRDITSAPRSEDLPSRLSSSTSKFSKQDPHIRAYYERLNAPSGFINNNQQNRPPRDTNMSHFNKPPSNFPTLLPPPDLEPRTESQTPGLDLLDAAHKGPISNGPKLEPDVDGPNAKDAMRVLEQHVANRLPYVQLASRRLQEAMGISNNLTYDIPDAPLRAPAAPVSLRSKYLMGDSVGAADAGKSVLAAARGQNKRDSAMAFGNLPSAKFPQGMHIVDKETGKGLREFLLQKGTEMGQKKTELKSISFHDFTPDMRTGEFRNKMLGHYAVDSIHERCVCYEVDLPTVGRSDKGEEIITKESWIWILISRPLISFESASGATEPPGFLQPVPTSWVVFAAPVSHITSYPETTESYTQNKSYHAPQTSSPGMKRVFMRRDYDFSHFGVPIFEFTSTEGFLPHPPIHFLSVDKMPGFSPDEVSEMYTKEEYADVRSKYYQTDECIDQETGELKADGKGVPEVISPLKGEWWGKFYKVMYEDSRRWGKIKGAMARGKCRVVLRWEELEKEEEKVVVTKKRNTRSESRKRSALSSTGTVAPIVEETEDGPALVDDGGRARALGNRVSSRGKEKDKGTGRVKKR